MPSFAQALPVVLRFEGGFVDDPLDRGGATNFGITQRTFDAWRVKNRLGKVGVRSIKPEEVEAIYHADYWLKGKCDALPWPASLAHFDSTVNHGPRNAAKLLQRAVGVVPDGKIGPQTREAVNRVPTYRLTEHMLWERVRFYAKIVTARPEQKRFLVGWLNRVLHLGEETDTA